jgi:hypothetical protein
VRAARAQAETLTRSADDRRERSAVIQWRRLDTPGSESALLRQTEEGWLLTGFAVFLHGREPCALGYAVACSEDWRTLSANVFGHVGTKRQDYRIGAGQNGWNLNGRKCPRLQGCIDIDLGFSPATNLLPIRRLQLGEGESADVEAAWFRFPRMELAPLAQKYTRETGNRYRYESPDNRFACTLETNRDGFVTAYPGYWSREPAP